MGQGSAASVRIIAACFVALACLLAAPSVADAYRPGGDRWPGSPARITFYDLTPAKCNWAIAATARAWNNSGARIRFVETTNRSRADMKIRFDGTIGPGMGGFATLGYEPPAWAGIKPMAAEATTSSAPWQPSSRTSWVTFSGCGTFAEAGAVR